MGGRFPALAVFGLPALSVALALVVLWGLRPWEDNSDPHDVPLGIEMAVGGGRALPAASTAGVAAGVAVPAGPKLVDQAARRASGNSPQAPAPAPIAVAPARTVAIVEASPSPASPEPGSGTGAEVPSDETTTGEAPSEGTSAPVAAPVGTDGGASGAPVAAGVNPVLASCEGDEYLLTITFLDEESTVEEAPVGVVLERLNEDGTTDELQLEGDLSDARSLISTLEAEGNCVRIEIAQSEDEGAEEAPGTSEETPGSSEEETGPDEYPVPIAP